VNKLTSEPYKKPQRGGCYTPINWAN
jgi:hypothetical protein